jgi:hypothetical protein
MANANGLYIEKLRIDKSYSDISRVAKKCCE